MARHWAATLKDAIRRTEGRDINLGQVMSIVVPHWLHLDYDLDFRTRRVNDVAPTLRGQEYPESLHPSRRMRTCGVMVRHLLSWMHPFHPTTMGWPPRDELAKGRPRKMSLLAKERVLRISLLRSLTSPK